VTHFQIFWLGTSQYLWNWWSYSLEIW